MKFNRDNILIIRPDRLGDVLLTLPLVETIKEYHPKSTVHFLCRPYTAELLQFYPTINRIISYQPETKHKGFLGIKNLALLLKHNKYDLAIHALPRFELALATYLAGIKYRLGNGFRWFSFLFNLRHYEHRKKNIYHEADCNLRLLQKINIPWQKNRTYTYPFQFTPQDYNKVEDILKAKGLEKKRYLVLHPGSGGSTHNWPTKHYRSLITLINQSLDLKVVLTGNDKEKQHFFQEGKFDEEQFIDLFGCFTLAQLAIGLSQAALLVSNSTGPLHLAVAMGVPVLGFYPEIVAMNPTRWGPYQRDVIQSLTPKNVHPDYTNQMDKITPEIALGRIKDIFIHQMVQGERPHQ